MKFVLSSSRKCQAPEKYESFDEFLSMEFDSANDTIQTASAKVHIELDEIIAVRRKQLEEEYHNKVNGGDRT